MKKNITTLLLAACAAVATAQGISPAMLTSIEKQHQAQPTSKALFNAVATNSIDDLARNYAAKNSMNKTFSVETPKQNIHNQKQSGRCWMFSGFNVLRAAFAKAHNDTLCVEYSHVYTFFYDQLEKSNLMLQSVIDNAALPITDKKVQYLFQNPVNDGGTFCGVADLADKYGLVPMTVMPETYSAENTTRMTRLIKSKLREYGLELRKMVAEKKSKQAIEARKTEMLGTIYNMLCLTLGEPVKSFSYTFTDKDGNPKDEPRTFTPQEFYRETVGGPINGSFIMVMNDPRHPYHKTYEVDLDRHTYDGHNWKYLNLPMEEIAAMAIASLKDGRKLYSSYDAGKMMDRKTGIADTELYDYASLMGTDFTMNKAERIMTFDSGSTHAMTLTAVDLDAQGNPIKWKVENSWSAESCDKGYVLMTDKWFNEYMFRLVVDKQYVPTSLLKEYDQKPTMLTTDDPLFLPDE
ncbi:C1 family peptidase [Sodaliphilus sp.]|uniref:C1 family peptidase n=1 Tax=Sodaliphilus sp. TaxID=2815818 RepID=UPI00388EA63B